MGRGAEWSENTNKKNGQVYGDLSKKWRGAMKRKRDDKKGTRGEGGIDRKIGVNYGHE